MATKRNNAGSFSSPVTHSVDAAVVIKMYTQRDSFGGTNSFPSIERKAGNGVSSAIQFQRLETSHILEYPDACIKFFTSIFDEESLRSFLGEESLVDDDEKSVFARIGVYDERSAKFMVLSDLERLTDRATAEGYGGAIVERVKSSILAAQAKSRAAAVRQAPSASDSAQQGSLSSADRLAAIEARMTKLDGVVEELSKIVEALNETCQYLSENIKK